MHYHQTYRHTATHFFFYSYIDPRPLHSFPTRRSSDLVVHLQRPDRAVREDRPAHPRPLVPHAGVDPGRQRDRKSTRLNSSHVSISYAVFCLKKKKMTSQDERMMTALNKMMSLFSVLVI